MLFGYFLLLVAALISSVSAYYSIAGLIAIFPGTAVPIIVMGVALEIAKLSSTVWLHHYWEKVSLQIKMYLIPAIVVLMLITSMGVFGFLSKSHISQTLPNDDISAQVEQIDQKIKVQQDIIDSDKRSLQQMDLQINKLSDVATDATAATRSIKIRARQSTERSAIQSDINKAQDQISKLQQDRFPLAAKVRKAEADVGPIKYIAQLIYGDKTDSNMLERAVRWVIILIVMVFDPLAVVLAISASQTISWAMQDRLDKPIEEEIETKIVEKKTKKFLVIPKLKIDIFKKPVEPEVLSESIIESDSVLSIEEPKSETTELVEKDTPEESEESINNISELSDSELDESDEANEPIDVKEAPKIVNQDDILFRIQRHINRDYHSYK